MTVPYGWPGNPAKPLPYGVAGSLSALFGGCCAGFASILGIYLLSSHDNIYRPKAIAGDYEAYDKAYDAWKLGRDTHLALGLLLVASIVLAVVLMAGGISSMRGNPAGRPLQLVGGGWVFVGGLITANFGGEHGLAFDAIPAFMLLIAAAVLALIACVYATIPPPPRPAPQSTPQHGQPPLPYQPPHS